MAAVDYSAHYSEWHKPTKEHAEEMAKFYQSQLVGYLPRNKNLGFSLLITFMLNRPIKTARKVRFILLLQFILGINVCYASEKIPTSLIVYSNSTDSFSELQYSKMPFNGSFNFIHPHLVVNKEKISNTFSGSDVSGLILKISPKTTKREKVTFVSKDSYTVSIPLEDIEDSKSFFGLKKNGVALDWKMGAPGVFFPKLEKTTQYLSDPSYWAWWVSALFVGSPKPAFSLFESQFDISKCSVKEARKLSYPRGRRPSETWKDKTVDLSLCKLQEYLPSKTEVNNLKLKIETLYGQEFTLQGASDSFSIVTKVAGEPIPPAYGGPIQVCQKNRPECVYFAKSISILK
jgi:hypothetical protein